MKEQAAVFCCDGCHHTDSYIHVNTDSFKKFVGRKKTARRRLLWLSKKLTVVSWRPLAKIVEVSCAKEQVVHTCQSTPGLSPH